ncbi:MAG: hypothetical protein ACI7YS_13105 [Flavobacterium sp.]
MSLIEAYADEESIEDISTALNVTNYQIINHKKLPKTIVFGSFYFMALSIKP